MNNHLSRQQRRAEERAGTKRQSWLPIAGWVIGVLAVVGTGWWLAQPSQSNESGGLATADDLKLCVTHGSGLSLHIHPHLTIIVDGSERSIPANVGIANSCLHPMHTHDGTGIIHIESPRRRDFTIGQFFQIWEQAYSSTKFMDTPLGADRQFKLFADGKEITTGPATAMKDQVSYVIMVGKVGETLTPPPNFEFPSSV